MNFHVPRNRAKRSGYEVRRVPMKNGHATGEYEDFLTGFVNPDGKVWGRPVGVTVAQDGALLVSDDGSDSIWRVSPAVEPEYRSMPWIIAGRVAIDAERFTAHPELNTIAAREHAAGRAAQSLHLLSDPREPIGLCVFEQPDGREVRTAREVTEQPTDVHADDYRCLSGRPKAAERRVVQTTGEEPCTHASRRSKATPRRSTR